MRRSWQERIGDMLDAIDAIVSHTAGMDEDAFAASRLVRDAVERNFQVIGEAMVGIPESVRESHPEIPWRQMRDMRNFLAHVYFGVNTSIVWRTVCDDLAPTAALLRRLLAEVETPPTAD